MGRIFPVTPREAWKYKELALGKIPDWGWELKDFQSVCLVDVADTFNWNLVRTSTFALMPAWIAFEAIREQLWVDHATVKSGRSINPKLSEFTDTTFSPEAEEEFRRLVMEYRALPTGTIRRLIDEIGINHIENHIATSNGLAVGVEIVYESVIRESWSAFESLVRDLWMATLDKDNGTIAARVTGRTTQKKPSKNVVPSFNIRRHPGSFQVETRLVIFQRLEEIRRLYELAFPHSAAQLFDNVESGYIKVLSAFRNVLSHKGARADQEFCDKIKGFSEFSTIKKGDLIAVNGESVRRMRDAAMILGRKLIELADKALLAQKP